MNGKCPDCRRVHLEANPDVKARLRVKAKTYIYKISEEEAEQLLAIDRCEMCGSDWKLCIDHNHETGKVRGVLCGNCNSALGLTKDSPELLRKLATYLEER